MKQEINELKKKIRAIVIDVDGTLTDGSIILSNNGELFKCFNVRDGYAIKHFLPQMGISPIILTGRESLIVQKRCEELDIEYVYQGVENKMDVLKEISKKLNLLLDNMAYIGDDVNDLDCINSVGLAGCPSDAVKEIAFAVDYVSSCSGGRGAVRDFIEWLRERE